MTDKKVLKLLDVVCAAWSKCLPSPFGDGEFFPMGDETHCNQYVNAVLAAYGYKSMNGLMANEMFSFLLSSSDWMDVAGDVAQAHANEGSLVIAAWKNPTGGHGHVSVVFPGQTGASSHWNSNQVPKLANVGASVFCKMSVGANWCFHDIPKYFVFKETLV